MGFLCDTFPRQLLTVLAVMLSRPDSVVRDNHIDVPTEQVGSNRTVEGRAALEGLLRRQQCRAEKRAGNGNRSVHVEDDPGVGSDN